METDKDYEGSSKGREADGSSQSDETDVAQSRAICREKSTGTKKRVGETARVVGGGVNKNKVQCLKMP